MNSYTPLDEDFEQKVKDSFVRQGFMKNLGAKLVSIKPGSCVIEVKHKEDLTQQHGYFHGGVSGAIADSACGYAGFTLSPKGCSVLAVEYKLNLVAPADGEKLIAKGEVIRSGKNLKVCRADVFAVKNGIEKLCATSLSTIMILHNKPDQ